MKDLKSNRITLPAMVAALYVLLGLISHALGIGSLQIQVRLSEMLTVLPVISPAAIPGLFVGCLLNGILTGAMLPDIIFGSLATLAAALLTRALKKNRFLAVLPPILVNTAVVPLILRYAYGIRPIWLSFITVFIGQTISAGILGLLFLSAIRKYVR